MGRGQTTTEYLIILAIVILISLIALNVLSQVTFLGSSSLTQIDLATTKSGRIGLESPVITNETLFFNLKNSGINSVTITNISINAMLCNSSDLPLLFLAGKSGTVTCTNFNATNDYLVNTFVVDYDVGNSDTQRQQIYSDFYIKVAN